MLSWVVCFSNVCQRCTAIVTCVVSHCCSQGDAVVTWLSEQLGSVLPALREAWGAVQRCLVSRAKDILEMLKAHPYVTPRDLAKLGTNT